MNKKLKTMKNIFRFMMTALVCAAIAGGCEKREAMAGFGDGSGTDDTVMGYLVFSAGGLTVEFDGERVSDSEEGAQEETRAGQSKPDIDDFHIQIFSTKDEKTPVAEFLYGATHDGSQYSEPIAVPCGSYFIRAYSGDSYEVKGESFWDGDNQGQPSWAGQTPAFEITRSHTQDSPYNAGEIKCTLQTVKVTLVLEQALAERFDDKNTKITVALSNSDRYDPDQHNHSLLFTNTEHKYGLAELSKDASHQITKENRTSDVGYLAEMESGVNAMFVYIDTNFTESDGTTSHQKLPITIASKEKKNHVQRGQWRKITLYLDAIDEETGRVTIGANIETWTYEDDVEVDVMTAVAQLGERVIKDMDPQMLNISSGDFDLREGRINEIAYTSDGRYTGSAGIRIANNTDMPVEHFMVNITSHNAQFSQRLKALNITEWMDIMNDNGATSGNNYVELYNYGFPRRSTIVEYDSEGFDFSLKNLMTQLYDYPGRHDVSIAVVNDDFYYRADLKLNVTKSSGGDTPVDPSDGPSIEWRGGKDFDKRYNTITETGEPLEVKIDMYAPAGIRNLYVKMSGALESGLAGLMPTEFDVAHTADSGDENLASTLKNFQFPVDDEVVDVEYLEFDITGFMSMLGSFYGDSDFQLTVVDNNDRSVTRTIKLHVVE